MSIDKLLDIFQEKVIINYQRSGKTIERRELNKKEFIEKLKAYGKFDELIALLSSFVGTNEVFFDIDELKKEISKWVSSKSKNLVKPHIKYNYDIKNVLQKLARFSIIGFSSVWIRQSYNALITQRLFRQSYLLLDKVLQGFSPL